MSTPATLRSGPALRARPPKRKDPSSANRTGQGSNNTRTLPFQYGKCKECRGRIFGKAVRR